MPELAAAAKTSPSADIKCIGSAPLANESRSPQRPAAPARPKRMQSRRQPRLKTWAVLATPRKACKAWLLLARRAECRCAASRGSRQPARLCLALNASQQSRAANKHTSPNACWPAVASLRRSSKRRAVLNVGRSKTKRRASVKCMGPELASKSEAAAKRRAGKPQAPRETAKHTASIHNRARLVQDLNPCADHDRRVLRREAFPAATLKQAIPLAASRPTRAPARPRAPDRFSDVARPGPRARRAVLNVSQ
jgi:hypothetical protein